MSTYINNTLVRLANKTVGFDLDALNAQQKFTPTQRPLWCRVQKKLFPLDLSVYYLSALNILDANTTVGPSIPKGVTSYTGTDFNFEDVSIQGATLVRTQTELPFVKNTTELDNIITLEYNTPTTLRYIDYTGTQIIGCTYIEPNLMSVAWPNDLIRGNLLLDTPQTTVTIELPREYPIVHILEDLSVDPDLFDLLSEVSLVDAFYFTDIPVEKLAIALYALYLTHGS